MDIVASDSPSVRPGLPAPEAVPRLPAASWRASLRRAIRDGATLCRALDLPAELAEPARRAAEQFGLFAPWEFVARMRPGDPADPLLRQVLPVDAESQTPPGYTADPVGDAAATVSAGLLHKYEGRALLVTTGACPVHCRYCFRRHFPYDSAPRGIEAWSPALRQIEQDPSLGEIILSGGDPLTLVDAHLAELTRRLAAIDHVRRLRVHTRMPIMIPQRVTDELLTWLRGTRLAPIVVVHANHPAEIDPGVAAALGRLIDAGVVVLNQAVLLRGINDDEDTLAALCERLVDLRVMPYYLHQLDRVAGAAHFEVPVARGRSLIAALRSRLPGYAVPRYVREEAGQAYKIPLVP